MFLFLLLLFPLIVIFYFCNNTKRQYQFVFFASFLVSMIFCTIAGLFGTSFHLYKADFFSYFLFLSLIEIFIPLVLLTGIFFLWSKDSVDFKINALFPLYAGFYMIYVPFRELFRSPEYSFFGMFCKPVLFVCMAAGIPSLIMLLYNYFLRGNKNSKKLVTGIFFSILAFLYLFIPAVLEAWFFCSGNILGVILCAFAYAAVGCGFIIINNRKNTAVQSIFFSVWQRK